MLNYSIESLGLTYYLFDTKFNVKFCARMMMSLVMLYENRKYDPYMIPRIQRFVGSNT